MCKKFLLILSFTLLYAAQSFACFSTFYTDPVTAAKLEKIKNLGAIEYVDLYADVVLLQSIAGKPAMFGVVDILKARASEKDCISIGNGNVEVKFLMYKKTGSPTEPIYPITFNETGTECNDQEGFVDARDARGNLIMSGKDRNDLLNCDVIKSILSQKEDMVIGAKILFQCSQKELTVGGTSFNIETILKQDNYYIKLLNGNVSEKSTILPLYTPKYNVNKNTYSVKTKTSSEGKKGTVVINMNFVEDGAYTNVKGSLPPFLLTLENFECCELYYAQ
jgi:hypothetical protein